MTTKDFTELSEIKNLPYKYVWQGMETNRKICKEIWADNLKDLVSEFDDIDMIVELLEENEILEENFYDVIGKIPEDEILCKMLNNGRQWFYQTLFINGKLYGNSIYSADELSCVEFYDKED